LYRCKFVGASGSTPTRLGLRGRRPSNGDLEVGPTSSFSSVWRPSSRSWRCGQTQMRHWSVARRSVAASICLKDVGARGGSP
jgi:hypothetical protein